MAKCELYERGEAREENLLVGIFGCKPFMCYRKDSCPYGNEVTINYEGTEYKICSTRGNVREPGLIQKEDDEKIIPFPSRKVEMKSDSNKPNPRKNSF